MKNLFLLLGFLTLAPTAFADTPQVYKWTGTDGAIHYSDKPPVQTAADLQTLDMPNFPAPDLAQIAARQAELDAEARTAQQLLQTQLDQEAQARALARQQAELEAELAAAQQVSPQPAAEPIYVNSAFVPRAFRANLYVRYRSDFGKFRADLPNRSVDYIIRKPR